MGFPLLFVLTHFSGIDLKTFSLSGFSNSVLSVDVISLVRFFLLLWLESGRFSAAGCVLPFPSPFLPPIAQVQFSHTGSATKDIDLLFAAGRVKISLFSWEDGVRQWPSALGTTGNAGV